MSKGGHDTDKSIAGGASHGMGSEWVGRNRLGEPQTLEIREWGGKGLGSKCRRLAEGNIVEGGDSGTAPGNNVVQVLNLTVK